MVFFFTQTWRILKVEDKTRVNILIYEKKLHVEIKKKTSQIFQKLPYFGINSLLNWVFFS